MLHVRQVYLACLLSVGLLPVIQTPNQKLLGYLRCPISGYIYRVYLSWIQYLL